VTIIIVTGVVGILFTLMVVRSIIRPLQSTTTALRLVNAGETDIDLPPIAADEFGDMALALRQFRDQAERLRKVAYEDPLTGLGNRARLEDALQKAIDRAAQTKTQLALLYLDLDNFRAINDRLGHKVGDRFLCEAVSRLSRFIPEDTLLCRFGGDKFTVLIENLPAGQSVEPQLREIANCALRGLAEPYSHGEHLLNMTASIGIALFPRDGETVEQLVSGADAAMFAAKKSGRNNVRFTSSEFTSALRRHFAVANDIRRGLEHGEFRPYYQPIVDTECGRVVGAEALLRWQHPERGLLLPDQFIDVAEEAGLIGMLGEECLRAAHRQAAIWKASGKSIRIAVNLSARQVHDGNIVEALQKLDAQHHAADRLIDLELTESALLDASETGQEVLGRIKDLGYRLGLDDFGTGYSSFAYLRVLPIDKIKIDRQFVAGMATSQQSFAIVSAIMALANNLRLEVVAEGIEAVEHVRALRKLGCTLHQGFFFSKALPAAEFEHWAAHFERQAASELVNGVPRPALIR
jgi:diguanylate cyclase (GGDEF)-like protein